MATTPTHPEPIGLGPTGPDDDLTLTAPPGSAAGVTAVVSSAAFALQKAGAMRSLPLLATVNQHAGFDCPSCAWPDPDDERSAAEFCENGARAVADAADRRVVTPTRLATVTVRQLAGMSDRWLGDAGRLTAPVVRPAGRERFEPISWDAAFALVGDHLRALSSPHRAAFYTSGRASNEAAWMYQLLARAYGTNNLPDCSNLCHESSGSALSPTIGIGKGTVTLEDFDHAELIVVLGQNPGTNHPRMLSALQRAKERGAAIVSINPLAETGLQRFRNPQDLKDPRRWRVAATGVDIADEHLPVRIGGDLALLTGVQMHLLARERNGRGGFDRAWLEDHVSGLDDLITHLDAQSWEVVERESQIARDHIEALADRVAGTDRIIWCWAMGLTQHRHAVGTIQQLVNLALLRGSLGRPGAGLCPVRGHSNVQGDRTVGIEHRPKEAFLDRLGSAVGFDPPREPGLDVVGTLEAMHAGQIEVLVALGGNLLSASPDTAYTAAAMQRLALNVQIATKLNRSHLTTEGTTLLLPCLARTDTDIQAGGPQFVTCENSMGIVQTSRGRSAPVSTELRSEPAIVAGLAAATLGSSTPVAWADLVADYDRIRDLIEASVPGFAGYNRRVRARGGLVLPNPAREGRFDGLPGGRAQLTPYPITSTAPEGGTLLMMTIRSHDQFNTTIYGDDDRYRGIHGGRRVVLVHPDDVDDLGLHARQVVDLVNTDGGIQRRAANFTVVPYELPRGCCATYFPEANVVVPITSVAIGSNTPTSKAVTVRLDAVTQRDQAARPADAARAGTTHSPVFP